MLKAAERLFHHMQPEPNIAGIVVPYGVDIQWAIITLFFISFEFFEFENLNFEIPYNM